MGQSFAVDSCIIDALNEGTWVISVIIAEQIRKTHRTLAVIAKFQLL